MKIHILRLILLIGLCQGCTFGPLPRVPDVSLERTYPENQTTMSDLGELVFFGAASVPIHRPSPEHFKLEDAANGELTNLIFPPTFLARKPERWAGEGHGYNHSWHGAQLLIATGKNCNLLMEHAQMTNCVANLYCEARLQEGKAYRLTWACWPVGSKKAMERSVVFVLKPETTAQPAP